MADTTSFASRLTSEESLEDMLRSHRTSGVRYWGKVWEKATRMQSFAGNDQWPDSDKDKISKSPAKSPRMTMNEIAPILEAFSGRQMMQRFERAYIPRHVGAARKGEIMTNVDRAMMQATDAEQVDSTAFKDGPGIQGISVVRWELDDLNERGGGVLIRELPVWQVIADPESRAINLSDRAWHRYGKWWPQSEVKARWPDEYNEIVGLMGGSSWMLNDMTESSRIPWAGMAGNKPLSNDQVYYPRGRALWIEYEEWREIVPYWTVAQPLDPSMSYSDTIQSLATAGPEAPDPFYRVTYDKLSDLQEYKREYRSRFGEDVPKEFIVAGRKLQYHYAYICGDKVLETDKIPTGYWTFQFLTGFRFPQANQVEWISLVERLVDAQKWVNVMLSALIRNIQITPKGLLFVEEGFFRNRNEALAAWGSPGGLIMTRRGALTGGNPGYKIEAGGTQSYANMVESLMNFWREAIPRLAGFNPGALGQLGQDLRRISGEVVRQVQDAAMVSNAQPFDALRHYRREGGRIFLSFLRRFFEVEDIVKIVGEELAYEDVTDPMTGQPVLDPMTNQPQRQLVLADKESWEADYWKEIAVEDVVPTGDQQEALWKALETSMPTLLQPQMDTGMPLFSSEDLVEIIPKIPATRREKMLQRVKQGVAAMQAQQAAAQPPPEGDIPPEEAPIQ